MLKNSLLFKEELSKKYQEIMYDMDYQYYMGNSGRNYWFPEDTYENHSFVSINDKGEVIGAISYRLDRAARRAYNFGAISFDRGNLTFTKDLLKAIEDIFFRYGMSSLDFMAFTDNPITPTYTKLVEKYGGRIVGVYYNNIMLQDGKLHNTILYEMTLGSYVSAKGGFRNV